MIDIKFIKSENRAVAYDGKNEIGKCKFEEMENIWNIVHTGVDGKYQGQGIAKKLVKCIMENSKKCNKNIIAECSYAKKIIESKYN
ncbi:MAG: N-acetyltransferase [Clostridium sp.]|nr:N-acetyltransferase [Clostridium sp.]